MQYKSNTKILIDKRKLDLLIRLGCPDKQIVDVIKTGNFTPTGDSLIDETLECLVDVKSFTNWGGSRNNAGRKSNKNKEINQVENQLENQVESHLANQDTFQVVDKDKDIYNNINININNNLNKNNLNLNNIYNTYFDVFWEEFKPVKCNGRFVDKGSKKTAYEKFVKLLKKGENYDDIIRGTREYISHCQENNQLTCGATVFLNQERWKNDYGSTINANAAGKHEQPRSIIETYAEIARKYQ